VTLAASVGTPASAQSAGRPSSVWEGVYTAAQASRGKVEYDANCASCHNGGEGPSLVGEGFMRSWFEDSLHEVFTKIRTSMPENAPGSLSDRVYLDILAFVLEANGFPSGTEELTTDAERLGRILVVGKEGPGGPVPNYSLVLVLGCLAEVSGSGWTLTQATEPVRARDPGESPAADLWAAGTKPPGPHVFKLLDFPPRAAAHRGRRVQAKGFLIRQPGESRLNLTSLQTLDQPCQP
jgi:mono/diheme cytochrome c family protein